MELIVCLTCDRRGDGASQGGDSCHRDFLWAVLGGAAVSSCDHVRFEESTFQIHVVVWHGFVHCSQDLQKKKKSFPSIPSLLLHHHQHQHHHHQPTFSVTYWPRFRSWSPSGKISGSMMGTMPCWPGEENSVRTTRDAQISSAGSNLLTDAAVTCKNIRVGHDGQSRGVGVADFKHAAPLCKGSAVLFILRATLW